MAMSAPQSTGPIGYGQTRIVGKWDTLHFSGDEKYWELWEERFMAYMRQKKLHAVINANQNAVVDDNKNAEAYSELVQFLDNRSLGLIMRDAKNDGRKAMKILRSHYAGSGKPRVILLYTQLCSLRKSKGEDVTDYIIRAETIAASLKSTGAQVDDAFLIAIVLKGLPNEYHTFSLLITQSEKEMTFQEFKVSLRNFEENEKAVSSEGIVTDQVMQASHGGPGRFNNKHPTGHNNFNSGGGPGKQKTVCFGCGMEGHKSNDKICVKNSNRYCGLCKSNSHHESNCRKKKKLNSGGKGGSNSNANVITHAPTPMDGLQNDFHSFHFKLSDVVENCDSTENATDPHVSASTTSAESLPIEDSHNSDSGLMKLYDVRNSFHFKLKAPEPTPYIQNDEWLVDSGCTVHSAVDESLFTSFDTSFKPEEHTVELADGTKLRSMAEKRGTVALNLPNSKGEMCHITLDNVLYTPKFPMNMFSVKAATRKGASVCFYPNHAEMITHDGTLFNIDSHRDLYFLKTSRKFDHTSHMNVARSLETWHSVLGHCNVGDIVKLQQLVDGLKIDGKKDFICEPCILGKQVQTVNHEPSRRATEPLEFVSTDLCGPITPVSSDGFEYAISFTDNFSGYIFIYFIRKKSDASRALLKFLADVSPIGKVRNLLNLVPDAVIRKLRSDNGGECMGAEFKNILIQNKIRHEQCAPYSPHQNGVAERGWRTLFESARSSLIESNLPKSMWPYALMNAAHVRNRCYQKRTKQTPYFLLTGRKPDVSSLHIFGTICYTYEQQKKKLDNRSKQGVFVGYDRESPSYLVYHHDTRRVQKCRSVKFTDLFTIPAHELVNSNPNIQYQVPTIVVEDIDVDEPPANHDIPVVNCDPNMNIQRDAHFNQNDEPRPVRVRNPPPYLNDYVCATNVHKIYVLSSHSIPKSYNAAMQGPDADSWKHAMDEEINSLQENDTYELVKLPEGKKTVGGRWVFTIKDGPDGSEVFKARYVAKGFTQVEGMDYFETFSPTVKMTSIRSFIQIAAEYGLSVS